MRRRLYAVLALAGLLFTSFGVLPRALAVDPPPTVTGLSLSQAPNTGVVTITVFGTGFKTGAQVKLEHAFSEDDVQQIPATGETRTSSTRLDNVRLDLTGHTPTAYDVVVTNPDSQSNVVKPSFTITGGVPEITTLTPSEAPPGSTGLTVTLTGNDYARRATITFDDGDGNPLNDITVNSTQWVSLTTYRVNIDIPDAIGLPITDPVEEQDVVIENFDGKESLPKTFFVRAAAPTEQITSISPNSASNTESSSFAVTIVGANFTESPPPVAVLKLDNFTIELQGETVDPGTLPTDPDEIDATLNVLGQPPGKWDLQVTDGPADARQTGTLADAFTIGAATPTISSVSPARVVPGGNDVEITINGANFARGMTVTLGTALSVVNTQYVSPTQLKTTVKSSTGRADAYDVTVQHYKSPLKATCSACFALVGDTFPYWMITNRFGGPSDRAFSLGTLPARYVACDWDGDGSDEPVIFRSGRWGFAAGTTPDDPTDYAKVTSFGRSGDTPLCGDWNGDGIDTIGIRRGTTFMLRNVNSGGAPSIVFKWGKSTDIPVVGDWNRVGGDGVGLYRAGGRWFLKNALNGAPTESTFTYGTVSGDKPVAGDWNGDGVDTPGIRRGRSFYLRDNVSSGRATRIFKFGLAGYPAMAGNWNGDPIDTVGVVVTS